MGLFERILGPNVDRLLEQGDVPGLTQVLGHKCSELRCQAARALGELEDDQAASSLIEALGDSDSEVAAAAKTSLGRHVARAGTMLGEAIGHEQETISTSALDILLGHEPPMIETLAGVLKDGNDQARARVADALVGLVPQLGGDETREIVFRALLPALGDRQPETRTQAATGLGMLGDPRAAKALSAQLKDGTETVRSACAEALEKLGSPVLPYLVDTLGDRNVNARASSARLLGSIAGTGDPGAEELMESVVERLREAVEDRDARVRESAIQALDHLGVDPEETPDDSE
jgi:HEAT repeat protein